MLLCRMGGKPIMFLDSVLLQALPGFLFCQQIKYSRVKYQIWTNFALNQVWCSRNIHILSFNKNQENAAFGKDKNEKYFLFPIV